MGGASGCVTLSLHKLWAGSGYDYLTRQVARQDATHPGRSSLASYYTERGETPGVWVGAGLAGVEGLAAGDAVTAEQMQYLFGRGLHPLAEERVSAAAAKELSPRVADRAGRLGSPFRLPAPRPAALEVEVERRLAVLLAPATGSSPAELEETRARLMSEVAADWFERDHGRRPTNARELAAAVARWSRGPAQPVAGFDLTFSPVKSVSALWAVAPLSVAAEIERAHRAAIADALRFVEERALFTRQGTNGVRQVEVFGLVAAAFTHRDSRAGDPDLHTHVAVANKVQTREGRWLSVDGRVLYAATVAASETYNTALEGHLGERLGVRFQERPATAGRRAVRELVGMDPRLLTAWSSRRQAIDVRSTELSRDFHLRTGRPPTRPESWKLAQQATLQTRDAKHEPRTLSEQRSTWLSQAAAVLGRPYDVDAMVARTLTPAFEPSRQVDAAWVAEVAADVVGQMEEERATWGQFHLLAEAQRRLRGVGLPPGLDTQVSDLVVAEAMNRSVLLQRPGGVEEAPPLRRSDGGSVYEPVGSERWTSHRVLDAERLVLQAAARQDGRRVDAATVEVALQQAAAEGTLLNPGQVGLVRDLAGSGDRLQLALAPAGTGKTTALRVLTQAWSSAGGTVAGLAPSAAAAAVLSEQLGTPTDTLAKLVWSLDHPGTSTPAWLSGLGPETLVVVDEAGLADTPRLARAIAHVMQVGGSVRLVGDDRQLGAVGAGGLLRDLADRFGATRLEVVVRFDDPAEAAASLALREGRPESLGFYLDQGRVHVGDLDSAPEQLLAAWAADRDAGRDALMLAPTRSAVAQLNTRARSHRLQRHQLQRHQSSWPKPAPEVALADGLHASEGDVIITRTNDRRLRVPGGGWVRNGARWTVQAVGTDGSLAAAPLTGGSTVRLPAAYVAASVGLGYATTVHAAQGLTCDTVHGLVSGAETRPQLYTLLTRGRSQNHLYLQMDGTTDLHDLARPDASIPATPTDLLERILGRDGQDRSASGHLTDLHNPALRLPVEAGRYLDALHLAVERTTDPSVVLGLDQAADHLMPSLRDAPAWPALRASLLLRAADGASPVHQLRLAAALGPLDDVRDPAAVLHERAAATLSAANGPLPWVPAVPQHLQDHPSWGPYLGARSQLVTQLAHEVQDAVGASRPEWASHLDPRLSATILGDIAVWRAAQEVDAYDPRITGPRRTGMGSRWQRHLDECTRVGAAVATTYKAQQLTATAAHDPFRETLSRKLARLASLGVDVDHHLRSAASGPPLPDDHSSAALWWRLHRLLPATILSRLDGEAAAPVQGQNDEVPAGGAALPLGVAPVSREARTDAALLVAGLLRLAAQPRHLRTPSPADSAGGPDRERLLHVNRLAHEFYRNQLPGSWSARHLTERYGYDLADDDRVSPGHAPLGWTTLVEHLREINVTDDDMIATGLAVRTYRGSLVDRFHDRLVLPIQDGSGNITGFVARRHPDADGSTGGPKYLNTPTTVLFTKSSELYGRHLLPVRDAKSGGTSTSPIPVLVEGPLDAVAVTLAGHGRYIGLAALGTALTSEQAAVIARHGVDPVLALDADSAGIAAATRDFWRLTQHGLDPLLATLPDGLDPAELLTRLGPGQLHAFLAGAELQGEILLRGLAADLGDRRNLELAVRVVAARPPEVWAASIETLSRQHRVPEQDLRQRLVTAAGETTGNPSEAARQGERLMTKAAKPAVHRSQRAESSSLGPKVATHPPAR